jgi:Flp pilus assembly protein CpaB
MQNRLKIALVVAVFFGLIAAYGIYNFLSHKQKEADSLRASNQDIVIAAQDIPPGTTINEEAIKKGVIKTTPWPKSSIPAGAYSSPQQIIGKVNRV